MNKFYSTVMIIVTLFIAAPAISASAAQTLPLKDNWQLQSSVEIKESGQTISTAAYIPKGWYQTSVPTTVLAALAASSVYPDPFYGLNLESIPGYQKGRWLAMKEDSPFYPPWWYRTVFALPSDLQGKNLVLHLDGVNYKANVWLNGQKIADEDQVIGMFRRFEINVSQYIRSGEDNCLAVEVIAPGKLPQKKYLTKQLEATTGWDDHNPYPPDSNLGLWSDVYLTGSGPLRIKNPYVGSKLDLPGLDLAHLTVSAYVVNVTDKEVTGELSGKIEDIKFTQRVTLAAHETRLVKFTPADYAQLNVKNPRLWWPNPVGPQNLYDLYLEVSAAGAVSDSDKVRFGIRDFKSYLNDEGWRQYEINGKKILIRGGAWMTSDMLLRVSEHRYEALVRYAREANLNMLRSEGFSIRETDEFYNMCDKYGVMVTQQIFGRNIPDEPLARACVEDMMLRIRNHPSLVHFLGHDETFPTETLDQAYRDMIADYMPDRTYQPHSGAFNVKDRWKTGGTRTGTRELWTCANPEHYYTHKNDGAWGFAQSGGIGGIAACAESIKRMMPAQDAWPVTSPAFSLHTVIQGENYFDAFFRNLDMRYGKPSNIDDWAITAAAMNYDSARGMFEAYGRNKYAATGITTWKYDTSWPEALTWQYVDWYLQPTGAYYGAKKACEALHVQFAYDDNSVYVVNSLYQTFKGLKASARVLNFDLREKFSQDAAVDVPEDDKTKAFTIELPQNLSTVYFIYLKLEDGSGKKITDNFYWMSTRPDVASLSFRYPLSVADLKDLRNLPQVKLDLTCSMESKDRENVMRITARNAAQGLAFFSHFTVTKGKDGYSVAPQYWQENYFSLLPGESREIQVTFAAADLEGKPPVVKVDGFNIDKSECIP